VPFFSPQDAEPTLASFLYSTLLVHASFEKSLAFTLSNKLASPTLFSTQLMKIMQVGGAAARPQGSCPAGAPTSAAERGHRTLRCPPVVREGRSHPAVAACGSMGHQHWLAAGSFLARRVAPQPAAAPR
jgi:hypothetical protein